MRKTTSGFTIVELLIVIVVIAILAAISIVAYNGIQERAKLTSTQAKLKQIYTKANVARADTGNWPNVATVKAIIAEVSPSPGTSDYVYCAKTSTDNYAIVINVPKISPSSNNELQFVSTEKGGLGSAIYSQTQASTAGSWCDAALPGWNGVWWYGSM